MVQKYASQNVTTLAVTAFILDISLCLYILQRNYNYLRCVCAYCNVITL